MSDSSAIEVRDLCKSFDGKRAVNHINLQVEYGEIFGFLGPNGSGKTTAIRMLCGLLTPDAGEGHCLGFDIVTESRMIKMQAGYMTQRFSFYADLTVEENLSFIAKVYLPMIKLFEFINISLFSSTRQDPTYKREQIIRMLMYYLIIRWNK